MSTFHDKISLLPFFWLPWLTRQQHQLVAAPKDKTISTRAVCEGRTYSVLNVGYTHESAVMIGHIAGPAQPICWQHVQIHKP